MKVVRMLNVLYTTFDVLTDPRKNPNIYKVKNIRHNLWRRSAIFKEMEKKNEKSRSEKSIHEGDIYVEWMEPATGDVTSNETPQEINTSRKEHIFCNGFGCQYSFANGINKSRTKSAGDGDVLYCRDTELAKTFV
jgi:hypothetical protein